METSDYRPVSLGRYFHLPVGDPEDYPSLSHGMIVILIREAKEKQIDKDESVSERCFMLLDIIKI